MCHKGSLLSLVWVFLIKIIKVELDSHFRDRGVYT
jgi:hypothetical protein